MGISMHVFIRRFLLGELAVFNIYLIGSHYDVGDLRIIQVPLAAGFRHGNAGNISATANTSIFFIPISLLSMRRRNQRRVLPGTCLN